MIYTYSKGPQIVSLENPIIFDYNGIGGDSCGLAHESGSPVITIRQPGCYIVNFNCDATALDPSVIQFQLYNKNDKIESAVATNAIAQASDPHNFSFSAGIKVRPSCAAVNNTAKLSILNTGKGEATINSVALTIHKV